MNASTTITAVDFSNTLNDLIEICIDGQKGFASAADAMDNPQLKAELMGFSQQRMEFAGDLQDLLSTSGDSPATTGSVAGTVHRGWLNLRDAVSTRETYVILAECERGEEYAVSAYKSSIDEGLGHDVDQLIRQQYTKVQATHDRVRALRDAAKPK